MLDSRKRLGFLGNYRLPLIYTKKKTILHLFLQKLACHYSKVGLHVSIITNHRVDIPKTCLDNKIRVVTVLDILDQLKMILEESSKTDVLVVLDVPFFYRENPLDPTVKRLFNFILAYLRALSESKIVVVSTEINMDEQPIAIKSSMFWSDCICEVDQLKDSNSEFILKILDRNARVEVKLGIAFENDGGIIWKIL